MENIEKLSDSELYKKCRFYGAEARKWTKKFAALLPEAARRELYKKYGFYSIFEFAAKLAVMKHDTVVDILRVAKKLEDKPLLGRQMETQGWGKLKVIATIATKEKENEKMLAEKVKEMSLTTLVTFVQEMRKENSETHERKAHSLTLVRGRIDSAEGQINLLPTENAEQNLRAAQDGATQFPASQMPTAPMSQLTDSRYQHRIPVRFLLTSKTELRIKELQRKLSRKRKTPVDLNEVVDTLLEAYGKTRKIAKAPAKTKPNENSAQPRIQCSTPAIAAQNSVKQPQKMPAPAIAQAQPDNISTQPTSKNDERFATKIRPAQTQGNRSELFNTQQNCNDVSTAPKPAPPSRYIPARIKKILYSKFHGRCAWPGCTKLPDIYHHTLRFALNPDHDPDHLAPLCKAHEQLAHHGLIENEEQPPDAWRLRFEPDKTAAKWWVDQYVNKYRKNIDDKNTPTPTVNNIK